MVLLLLLTETPVQTEGDRGFTLNPKGQITLHTLWIYTFKALPQLSVVHRKMHTCNDVWWS